MLVKMIDIILDSIGNGKPVKSSRIQGDGINPCHHKEMVSRKHDCGPYVFDNVVKVFRYMNGRARHMNRDHTMMDKGMDRIMPTIKEYCSRPHMVMMFVALPLLYLISPKAVIVVPLLIFAGAVALVVQSFLPIYIGLDFSLMGAVLGSILFGPVVGVMIVLLTYILAMKMPSGHQDALEYERILLFSVLALIIPFIPVNDIMLKAIVATYIGELMEMVWHRVAEEYPWSIAFLKVFPRSVIYIYVFHKVLVFLV